MLENQLIEKKIDIICLPARQAKRHFFYFVCFQSKLNSVKRDFVACMFTIVVILMCSCKHRHEASSDSVRVLEYSVTSTIALPLDSFCTPNINYFQLIDEDSRFVFYNQYNQSLYIYDIINGKLIDRISLVYDQGPLPALNAFYYINSDSILLFPEYGDFFFVANELGVVSPSKITFVDSDDQDKIESHWIKSSSPLVKRNDKIYINNSFGWIAHESDEDKFLLIEYDLHGKTSEFLIKHPSFIYDNNFGSTTWKNMVFTYKEPTNSILYSFYFDPHIYEYSGDKDNIVAHYCALASDRLPAKLSKNLSSTEAWLNFQTNFSFSSIIYDKFRDVLVRVVLDPYKIEDIRSGSIDLENPKKPSLYFFDKHYKFIGKLDLAEDANYYFTNMFVNDEGLWIQRLLKREDQICFDLIDYVL